MSFSDGEPEVGAESGSEGSLEVRAILAGGKQGLKRCLDDQKTPTKESEVKLADEDDWPVVEIEGMSHYTMVGSGSFGFVAADKSQPDRAVVKIIYDDIYLDREDFLVEISRAQTAMRRGIGPVCRGPVAVKWVAQPKDKTVSFWFDANHIAYSRKSNDKVPGLHMARGVCWASWQEKDNDELHGKLTDAMRHDLAHLFVVSIAPFVDTEPGIVVLDQHDQNVIVLDGRVLFIDFGIAKLLPRAHRLRLGQDTGTTLHTFYNSNARMFSFPREILAWKKTEDSSELETERVQPIYPPMIEGRAGVPNAFFYTAALLQNVVFDDVSWWAAVVRDRQESSFSRPSTNMLRSGEVTQRLLDTMSEYTRNVVQAIQKRRDSAQGALFRLISGANRAK